MGLLNPFISNDDLYKEIEYLQSRTCSTCKHFISGTSFEYGYCYNKDAKMYQLTVIPYGFCCILHKEINEIIT